MQTSNANSSADGFGLRRRTPANDEVDPEPDHYPEDATEDPTLNYQPLEVYLHYAALERQYELHDKRPVPDAPWTVLFKRVTGDGVPVTPKSEGQRFPTHAKQLSSALHGVGQRFSSWRGGMAVPADSHRLSGGTDATGHSRSQSGEEGKAAANIEMLERGLPSPSRNPSGILVSRAEKETVYRLMRVASWQVVFYLIMTDMAGWFTAPQTFNLLGYAPGVMVYTAFYLLAFGSGQILWRLYLRLDSQRYPVKSYADLAERTFGPVGKYVFNTLQTLQLILQVGMFLIMDGHGLSEIIDFKLCFLALNVFFALAGIALSQFRTLRNIAIVTHVNLMANILVMIMIMFGVTLYDPVPATSGHADLSEPIRTSVWVPETTKGWYLQVSGLQIAVFAYGGATIFTEFMAEMRRPRDFWRAALTAQFVCWALYLLFGLFGYSIQGQYTSILPTINIANRAFQGMTNIIGLYCSAAVGILYSHIGCKVLYRLVCRGVFKAPSLTTRGSKLPWFLTTCAWWILCWVVGSAIPNIEDINTVVGSVFILQMTYSLPPLLLLGHWIQVDAIEGDGQWRPGIEPYSNRADTWSQWSRWKRGLFPKWYLKLGLVLLSAGIIALAVMGLWAGVLQVQASYAKGALVAFSCDAPTAHTK